jgi:hypothetical protein
VSGIPNPFVRCKNSARHLDGQVILAQVNPVGIRGPCHISPIVHNQAATGVPQDFLQFRASLEELPGRRMLVTKLYQPDARRKQFPRYHRRRTAARPRGVDNGIEAWDRKTHGYYWEEL